MRKLRDCGAGMRTSAAAGQRRRIETEKPLQTPFLRRPAYVAERRGLE